MPFDIENRMVVDEEWEYLEEAEYHANRRKMREEQALLNEEERKLDYEYRRERKTD